jgi:hypothetical protein
MVELWMLFAGACVLWIIIALLWEHRCKNKEWELEQAEDKIRELEDKNRSLEAEIIAIHMVMKGK